MAKHNRMRDDWGSVSYDAGRRVGRIRYWSRTPDGYRRVSETVRGSRRDVERRRAELRLVHDDDAPCPTVRQLWETSYHPYRLRRVEDGHIAPQTLSMDESAWRVHVGPMWGDARADSLRPAQVQDWLDGMTRFQADRAIQVLRGILRHAALRGLVGLDPIAGVPFELPKDAEVRDRGIWTLEELGAIWRAVRGEWWEPAYLLSAFGSARVGESLGPHANEVSRMDVDGLCVAVVPVVRQVANNGKVRDEPKNSWSVRPLVLPGPVGERVLEIAAANDGDWLTGNGSGLHTRQSRLGRAFDRALSRAGVERHPFRNLRPSWQTFMRWDMGVAPERLEKMMGHIGLGSQVTAQHYDRPTAELFAQTVAEAYRAHPYADGWLFD